MDATTTTPALASPTVERVATAEAVTSARPDAPTGELTRFLPRTLPQFTADRHAAVDDTIAHACLADRRLTITVTGDLDMGTTPILTATVDRHLDATTPTAVVFDLRDVTFIDCTGINGLLAYTRGDRAHLRDVTLTHVPTRVRRLLDLAGLTQHFHLSDDAGPTDTTPHRHAA